jgi:murein DD-endopeptidase MepM/ murein hydrolase activator NlpD
VKKVIILMIVVVTGYLLPAKAVIPVKDATKQDWHHDTYWYYPWGKSGVHKGIDIFAKKGTSVISSVSGIVLFNGNIALGGQVIAVLGPKWRIHYYAHLQSDDVHILEYVNRGEKIGRVGTTGNAVGKPPHLHYSVLSLIPNIGEITLEPQGWKRMFYINPTHTFN